MKPVFETQKPIRKVHHVAARPKYVLEALCDGSPRWEPVEGFADLERATDEANSRGKFSPDTIYRVVEYKRRSTGFNGKVVHVAPRPKYVLETLRLDAASWDVNRGFDNYVEAREQADTMTMLYPDSVHRVVGHLYALTPDEHWDDASIVNPDAIAKSRPNLPVGAP